MFRTNRRQPGFDSLETVVLLSTRAAARSSSAQKDAIPGAYLELNGTLHGNKIVSVLDARVPRPADSHVKVGALSFFDTSGRLSPLGKVSGSFGLNEATDVP